MPQFYTDPSIATRAVAQQQQLLDPMEAQAKALSLREMLDRQQDRGLQRQERQQQLAERRLIVETLGKHGGNVDKAMPELAGKIGPESQASLLELQKGARSSQKELLQLRREQGQALSGIIARGKQMSPEEYQQNFPMLRERALQISPGLQLPEFVPQEGLDELGLGLLTQDMVFGAAEEGRKQETADTERPSKRAKSAQDQFSLAAQSLGNSKTQAEWTRKRAFLANRVDPDTLGLIPEQFSPEAAAEVRQLAAQLPKEGTLSDFEAAFQRDYGRPPTTKELVAHKRDMAQAGRAVVGGGAGAGKGTLLAVPQPDGTVKMQRITEGMEIPKGSRTVGDFSQPENKKVTGANQTALRYMLRGLEASDSIAEVEDKIAKKGLGGQVWLNTAPNWAQTPEGQLYNQAASAFTEARLRKDSGAAIPPHEYVKDRKTYFAQPGDSAEVLLKKQRGRAVILEGLASETGAAFEQYFGEPFKPGAFKEKYGGPAKADGPGVYTVTDPNGKVHPFPSQAAADAFKKAAGIQ